MTPLDAEMSRFSKKLRELMLDHMVNRTLYSAGLRSHQVVDMASGKRLNLFSRKGDVVGSHTHVLRSSICFLFASDRVKIE